MIISRAPMRISFVGGGTDLPDFYSRYPGRVISTAIDQFVHVALNRTPMIDKIAARYSRSESVDRPQDLEHTRIRAALIDMGITKGLEIASFANLPSSTGLGSSSSFTVALLKALYAFRGKKVTGAKLAEAASRLEIELVGEPIGKQDQYAAAFGGMNFIQFNADGTTDVRPVLLDYKARLAFEDRILLIFTGITRDASSVLKVQKANIDAKMKTLKEMSDSVPEFEARLSKSDFPGMGQMLHDGWLKKKSLASNSTTSAIDKLYEAGKSAGAWGGKLLGAGGGGCIIFLADPAKKAAVRAAVVETGKKENLTGLKEIPIHFIQSGAELIHNSDNGGNGVIFS